MCPWALLLGTQWRAVNSSDRQSSVRSAKVSKPRRSGQHSSCQLLQNKGSGIHSAVEKTSSASSMETQLLVLYTRRSQTHHG